MAFTVNDKFQPIWASTQLMSIGTASATTSAVLPTCGAVRIASGGAQLFYSFTGSASSSPAVGMAFLPPNQVAYLETAGGHAISFKVDTSANPMNVSVMPCV